MELGERAVEAQACYSLGNTYTLLRDFPTAIDYHQRHLAIAQELGDRIGEARACWSLGNAHSSIGNHEKALHYANSHHILARELGDVVGENTAKMNISDLRKILGLPEMPAEGSGSGMAIENDTLQELPGNQNTQHGALKSGSGLLSKQYRVRRQSMEQLDLIKVCFDCLWGACLFHIQRRGQLFDHGGGVPTQYPFEYPSILLPIFRNSVKHLT